MIQFANSHNVTWDYTAIGYWSTLEVHVGIIIACLPAVRSLQRRVFPSSRSPNSYYLGPTGAYGYNSKGGSPFPSMARSKPGHIDLMTAASQATMLRSRNRTSMNKEFIQMEEYKFHPDDKPSSRERQDAHNRVASNTTRIERGSIHSDDSVVLLPIQSTRSLSPPRAVHQKSGRNNSMHGLSSSRTAHQNSGRNISPQVITVTKGYGVTVELTPEQLSSSPPRESEDLLTRGRSDSQTALTRFSGIERGSSTPKRLA
jgi:hypothetical protein